MLIPKKIIDNSDVTLRDFLNEVLAAQPQTNLDIATAFFSLNAYAMIKENLGKIGRLRLLLGKTPEVSTDTTLEEELLKTLKQETESYELSKDNEALVKDFIQFLKQENVEVRIYDKTFLHGKAYIFDNLVVIGSSNFTPSGLTHNTELNSVSLEAEARYARQEWFDKFWAEARDFKKELVELLEASRFGSQEYSPYQIFIKALYELQKEDIKEIFDAEKARGELPRSRVNLAEFQEDAVRRVFSRLRKYKAALIADSVGLGKTWIAKRIIEEFGFYRRKKFLVIVPAQLREMWSSEIKDLILTESLLSQEELAAADFMERAHRAVGGDLAEVALVIVDESHNFRNPLSNRWENLFSLLEAIEQRNGARPYIVFLTATPINNTLWDLYWQIVLLVLSDNRAFARDGIPDLLQFFKEINKKDDPSLLADLLNEISIRRTRDYIKKNYPNAEINGKRIVFPERVLENLSYRLDASYRGMYHEISEILAEKLKMAYYRILEYKKTEKLSQDEQFTLGRMIALEGIFRTVLLKRLESSVDAFHKSISRHVAFLKRLKEYLEQGKLLTKQAFNKYVVNFDEESWPEDIQDELEEFKKEDYKVDKLFEDIDNDVSLLERVLERVSEITPDKDAKLQQLESRLIDLACKGQVVVFTYYADTLDYISSHITKSKNLGKLRIEAISGRTPPSRREELIREFMKGDVHVLMSTDVLSEGMNLQAAQFVVNYDLHWNPMRMIQRSGRIDRIGSPYHEIFIYNFFPEEELEDLLRLVSKLQKKIREIDESIGLDETVLGEEVHPKVFGIIRRIHQGDSTALDELEEEAFGGGEKFYQPLREFIKTGVVEELEKIPYGVFSGLRKGVIKGIFFYYKYGDDFHFWYLFDMSREMLLTNKSEILGFICCPPQEERFIPDFFERVYEVNKIILQEIETTYRELEQAELTDRLDAVTSGRASKFLLYLVREVRLQLDSYLLDFPEEMGWETKWNQIEESLLKTRLTKRRLRELRRIWGKYKNNHKDWKQLLRRLESFVAPAATEPTEALEPFDPSKLRLVVIDFIS